jgi:GDPmannose 4,6-dehydratase
MKRKKALITGVTGQDGSYLSEILLNKGYEVHGIKRRSSSLNTGRVDHIFENIQKKKKKFILHYGDLSDGSNLSRIINHVAPDEIYNLGAQSHVNVSFELPEYTAQVNAIGTIRILEEIKKLRNLKKIKYYQASTSELYGKIFEKAQDEKTPFYPRSPYAISKLFAYWTAINYREAYGLYVCNGILFNHESPRRGETFVTRKITLGLCKIVLGLEKYLYLGNLNAKRDWGHAKDYMEMAWKMMQQKKPDDYVIATGESHTIRDFLKLAAKELGFVLGFKGSGLKEIGYIKKIIGNKANLLKKNQEIIKIDERYFRPTEVDTLLGDFEKAKKKLGWSPKITIKQICSEMISSDYKILKNLNK